MFDRVGHFGVADVGGVELPLGGDVGVAGLHGIIGLGGCGDLDFQAMSPSWTLRTIHFSNFKTKKILMEVLGNLEICNISYLMFGVFERLFITVVIPGSGNDRFFKPRKGQEVAMNENI